ncbi:hypothetical protein QA612_18485 [Evansella sp. AB-P1]|uniref:hypothetical protein n=1 Tax=Evansella sp. AB-P1 TaxID=3037653 RepID=UPI00241E44EE|nr:hypothetical protein [Evansella sp. AB-P1]MDG5789449.1 hypothetical protein [Evansella sp. AB-P1]
MRTAIQSFEEFKVRLGADIAWSVIDDLVVSDANILRPVKGHAFEILFDEVAIKSLGATVQDVGGDTSVDRELINGQMKKHTLQLKTPASSTIKLGKKFGVSLHKTHGQEKRPKNLYPMNWPCPICEHDGDVFPDFLVILHPVSGVLIVPKVAIPESQKYPGHFADPAYFEWDSEWLNRWDLLGYPDLKGKTLERRSIPLQEKLPKIAKEVNLTDLEIVEMWIKPENFRMIDMNLRGNLREPIFTDKLLEKGVITEEPTHAYPKYDRITKLTRQRVQIKGPSKNLTKPERNIIGAEVMGTHGRDANRRYSQKDFDYFGLVIDPNKLPPHLDLKMNDYHFCLIPVNALPLHYKNDKWGTEDKLYEGVKFFVGEDDRGVYLKPWNNYRNSIAFREEGPWYLNEVPDNFK